MTLEGNESLSKFPPLDCRFINQITITLDQHSRIASDFDDMDKEFFFYALLINQTLFSKLISLAYLFQRFWNKISQKISTRLARHHIQRYSASDAAA